MAVAVNDSFYRFFTDPFFDQLSEMLTLLSVIPGIIDNEPFVGFNDGVVNNRLSTYNPYTVSYILDNRFGVDDFTYGFESFIINKCAIRCCDNFRITTHIASRII